MTLSGMGRLDGRSAGLGAVAGVLAAGAALGVGQFAAGLTGASGSPVVVVGELQIDFTPPWLKNFAITEFGADDKLVLVTGIVVVLGAFAALVGAAATRRMAYGMAGIAVFAAVGLTAAATRPHATVASLLPTLAAVASAVAVFYLLIPLVRPPVRPAARAVSYDPVTGPAEPETVPAEIREPELAATDGSPRRSFLAAGAATAGIAAGAGLAGRLLTERSSVASAQKSLRIPRPAVTTQALPPGVDLHVPGLAPFVTPNGKFYRVDTALVLPQVRPDSWTLRIHGMVNTPIELSFAELLRRQLHERDLTVSCVSDPVGGPYVGNARWIGADLPELLRSAGIQRGADQLLARSADGMTIGTPLASTLDGRAALLAVAMNGEPLPIAHGFPARMIIPGFYGYASACKWVTDLYVTTFAQETAYWVKRGYARVGTMKTQSRIDVPKPLAQLNAGPVTVAGIAWATDRGISDVQVQRRPRAVADGSARRADSPDTWRQWVWEWDAPSGRAPRGAGHRQDRLHADQRPGAAGTQRGHRLPHGLRGRALGAGR